MDENPKPVSKKQTMIILNQMNNSLYKIKNNDMMCFFTKIKFKNINMPIMVTNYQIINYAINNINNINIFINNELNKIEFGKGKYLIKIMI